MNLAALLNGNPTDLENVFASQDENDGRADGSEIAIPQEVIPWVDLTDLVAQSENAESGNVPSYDRVFEALSRALHRRHAAHVLLVGERGHMPRTILAEYARRWARSGFLAGRRLLAFQAGFVAAEESRDVLRIVLAHVAGRGEAIVAVEGFAKLLQGEMGRTNRPLLFSILSRARCRIIGCLSPEEYEELLASDPDTREFFTRVDLATPEIDEAAAIVERFAAGLAEAYRVKIAPRAVADATALAENFVFHERLPGSAVRILRHACEEVDYRAAEGSDAPRQVDTDTVHRLVAEESGIPEETLRGTGTGDDFARSLGEVIFGQEHAVRQVATELQLIKAGLNESRKPASVLMFVGQTGTGKTEMAKALARLYSSRKKVRTFTLGNFVEPHSVAGIIGVPAGYVGHDAGGSLINDLNADPYGVFLLDEADKAHPDVLQPFLNVFDEGWIVDQRGVKAHANHAIFVLTTNVGQKMIADMHSKGKSDEEITERMKEALSQIKHGKANRPVFSPEFLARLKRVIVFRPLDEEAMGAIARRHAAKTAEQWQARRKKRLAIAAELIEYLGAEAHRVNTKSNGKEGGRIVRKLFSDLVDAALERAIAADVAGYQRAALLSVEPAEGWNAEARPEIRVRFAVEGEVS